MSNYRVEANTDYDEFCLQVQCAIRDGWAAWGNEIVAEGKYVQCFIRFSDTMTDKNSMISMTYMPLDK